jgi:hypothetical protein
MQVEKSINKHYFDMCLYLNFLIYHYPERFYDNEDIKEARRINFINLSNKYFPDNKQNIKKLNPLDQLNQLNPLDQLCELPVQMQYFEPLEISTPKNSNQNEQCNFEFNNIDIHNLDNPNYTYDNYDKFVDEYIDKYCNKSSVAAVAACKALPENINFGFRRPKKVLKNDSPVVLSTLIQNDKVTYTNVFIKTMTNKTVSIDVDLEHDTLADFKQRVQQKEHLTPEQQRYIFHGKIIDNDKKLLKDYNIEKNSILHLYLQLKGC